MENYPDSYYAQNIETLKKPYDQLIDNHECDICLLYTSPSPRDVEESRMPSSA